MNGKIAHIVYIVALLVGLYSCQDDMSDNGISADGNYLSFTLSTRATDMARSPEEGEDRFNENLIEKVDAYFFASNSDNAGCVYAQMDLTPSRINTTEYALQIPLDKEKLTSQTYYVYVVANSDDFSYTSSTAEGVSLQTIKEMTISTEWKKGYADNNTDPIKDAAQVKESSLVMDGGGNITIDPMPTSPEVIEMTRAMAKVMLFPTTAESIVTDGVTYTPIPGSMNVTMVYGVQQTNLQGNYAVQETDYIDRIIRGYNHSGTDEDGKIVYEQTVPFYSYPNPENTSNRKDTYLILCVPWSATIDGSQQALKYYYRVPISGSDAPAVLKRNTYYRIKVNIGVLGSLNPHDAVEVTDKEFEIMPWINTSINADMNNYRYLVLDEYNSVMNNVDELRMPYVSSSEIAWEDNRAPDGNYTRITNVHYWDYHNDESYEVNLTSNYPYDTRNKNHPVVFSDFKLTQEEDNGPLLISHPLNDDDDFVPYTITVEVYNTQGVHTDTWTITQYPAMYIVGENNEEGGRTNRFINGHNNGSASGVHVYDDSGSTNDDHYLGVVASLQGNSQSVNSNPNLYTIHITSFDVDEYAIGDPRSETSYSFGRDLDATEYKNTRIEAENIIAPAYKIASSWGKTLAATYEGTVKRCASYQEAGYPAGRWRIPTKAEVEYIVSLSEEHKIPRLFGEAGTTTDYWVSSGKYNTSEGYRSGTNGTAVVRCVYDVWYWGDQTIEEDKEHNTENWNNNQFIWGDAEDGSLTEGTEH